MARSESRRGLVFEGEVDIERRRSASADGDVSFAQPAMAFVVHPLTLPADSPARQKRPSARKAMTSGSTERSEPVITTL
jgi:hypothetical protein